MQHAMQNTYVNKFLYVSYTRVPSVRIYAFIEENLDPPSAYSRVQK